jgi:hypothetical protein
LYVIKKSSRWTSSFPLLWVAWFARSALAEQADVRPISMAVLKYMRHLQRSSYPEAQRASIPEMIRPEMEALAAVLPDLFARTGVKHAIFLA